MISIKSLPFRDRLTLLNGNFTSIYCFPWTTMSLVETKDRTARIYKEGETEQSQTGILQLPKWCYRLRGIKDNSLLVPNCRQSIGWDVSRYKSKLEKGEREGRQRFLSRWRNCRVVRVKTNAIRCVQVVWESVLLETSAKRARRKLDSFFIA